MSEGLVVILGRVPERFSQYSSALRARASRFLFFSEVASLLARKRERKPWLVVVDHVDGDLDADAVLGTLRKSDAYRDSVILFIVSDDNADGGLSAIKAGANDYLCLARVQQELDVRALMHSEIHKQSAQVASRDDEFKSIYPLDDRYIIRSAVHYIGMNLASIASARDLMPLIDRSEREINKAFTEHLNMTVFAYIRNCKISTAQDLLMNTRHPIADIALEVGYSNPANFATWFKGLTGLSPSQYRHQA